MNKSVEIINNIPYLECRNLNIEDFCSNEIKALLVEYGSIILQNATDKLEDFSALIHRASKQVVSDPARVSVGQTTLVDAGTNEVGLHLENGTLSKLPEMCWFYCEQAPIKGSQTTLCDGEVVWSKLTSECRKYFLHNKVKFSRVFAEAQWRNFVSLYYPNCGGPADVTTDDLFYWSHEQPGQEFTLNDDGSVLSTYTVGAVRFSQISQRISFANSLFSPSYNYIPPTITLADGEKINEDWLEEAHQCMEENTHNIAWQDNDIAIIDNSRVMHGRRKIETSRRKIYNSLSYL